MNFADKMFMEQETNERTVTITSDDFDHAMAEVMHEMANDPEIDGAAKLLMPLTGMLFAKQIKDKLFA